MTDLSPAAQQVFWEFNRAASGKPYDWHYLPSIAAALRTAADQVVPHEKEPKASRIAWKQRLLTRAQLLAIAYELEHR